MFQKGIHLKLIYLKVVTTELFLQEEIYASYLVSIDLKSSDFHEDSLIVTGSSHSRLGVSVGQVQLREVAFFPSFLAGADNCQYLQSSCV